MVQAKTYCRDFLQYGRARIRLLDDNGKPANPAIPNSMLLDLWRGLCLDFNILTFLDMHAISCLALRSSGSRNKHPAECCRRSVGRQQADGGVLQSCKGLHSHLWQICSQKSKAYMQRVCSLSHGTSTIMPLPTLKPALPRLG